MSELVIMAYASVGISVGVVAYVKNKGLLDAFWIGVLAAIMWPLVIFYLLKGDEE